MEAEEENCGFDTSCLEKLNIAPDFTVNFIYYVMMKVIIETKTTSCLDNGRAD